MRLVRIASALALAIVLASCGSAGSAGGAGGAGTAVVKISLADFKFGPPSVQVPASSKVTLTLTNTGSVEHTVTVEKLGVNLTVPPDGKRHDFAVGPFAAGTYDLVCTVAGHKQLGMVGTFVVK